MDFMGIVTAMGGGLPILQSEMGWDYLNISSYVAVSVLGHIITTSTQNRSENSWW